MTKRGFLVVRPFIRFFWLSDPNAPTGVLVIAGARREVFASLSEDDVVSVHDLVAGRPVSCSSSLIRWLVSNGWAAWSNAPVRKLPPSWNMAWSRQAASYSVFCNTTEAAQLQKRIAGSNVLIVGVGGAGCHSIEQLLGMGVRRFTLIDPDHVEESNLNRQVLFSQRDVGTPKVEAAAKEIARRINHHGAVRSLQTSFLDWCPSQRFLRSFDLAIVSADRPMAQIRKHATKLFFPIQLPFAFCGYSGGIITVGPVVFSPADGCGNCTMFCFPVEDEIFPISGVGLPFIPPSSSVVNAILAAVLVDKWARWLAGKGPANGSWRIDMDTGCVEYTRFIRLKKCPVCAQKK